MFLRSITLILTLVFSLSSYAGLNLPKYDSVTYQSIEIRSNEAKKANQRWMVVHVNLRGVKVLGKRYLNGNVHFTYDSHFQGDRAQLGMHFAHSGTSTLSKPTTRGGFKLHKENWGSKQYVGNAKWGAQSQVQQYIQGVKKNSEQDYVMINWMLANADEIIDYAVNNLVMSSKAKNGWKRLRSFTRAAYGNVNNNIRVLKDADLKTPKHTSTANNTSQLENKIKTLTYQVSQLNKRLVKLKEDNRKLESKLASYNTEPTQHIANEYVFRLTRTVGDNFHTLGLLNTEFKNGKIKESSKPSTFTSDYLPSRIVGSYQNNGDFELLVTADFMKKGSIYNRKTLTIKGNLFSDFVYAQSKYKGAIFEAKYMPVKEKQGDNSSLTIAKLNEEISKLKNQLKTANKRLAETKRQLSNNLSMAAKGSDKQAKRILVLEEQIQQLEAELDDASTKTSGASAQLKKRNSELTVKLIKLQEQLAEGINQPSLPLNYCLSTKLEHVYVTAANDNCMKPYVQVDAYALADITTSLNINNIATSPWIAARQWSKADILSIQNLMVNEGLSSAKPDGIFGPNTSKAVQKIVNSGDLKIVSNQLYLTTDANRDLLYKARIKDLEQKVTAHNAGISSAQISDYEQQLVGIKQQWSADLEKKDKLIRSLEQEITSLQTSSSSQSNTSNQKVGALTSRVAELQNQLAESNKQSQNLTSESTKKDTLIKSLEHELALLREDSSIKSSSSSQKLMKLEREIDNLKKLAKANNVEYELQVQKLNQLVANLNDQLAQSKRVADKHSSTVKSQEQEIKRLNSELTVAQEKIKKIRPTESSFMDNLSDEWRPHVSDMPLTERLFCDLYHNFNVKKAKAIQSNNQIQVNMVHRAFQEDLDSLIPGGELDQWIVKVLMVSQVSGGDAALIAELPCGVLVGSGTMTTKISGTDELTWAATIPYDSRLFNEIAKVSIGDFVNVSGTFVQVKAFKSGQNETYYASNTIGKNPLVEELGLENDLYLMDVAYFMMLR